MARTAGPAAGWLTGALTENAPVSLQRAEPSPSTRLLDLLGWAGRTDVERVRRYTEWSLYSMYWIFLVAYAGPAAQQAPGPVEAAITLALLVLLGVLGHRGVRLTMRRWPEPGVPWRDPRVSSLLAAAVLATAWGTWVLEEGHMAFPWAVSLSVAWGLGGLRDRRFQGGLVLAAGLLGWAVTGFPVLALAVAGFAGFMVFTLVSSLWLRGVVLELDRARTVEAELAVAQERLRFSSDVHDVLGRHLSTIAVQSELAAASVAKGDVRAEERIRLVRASAHEALREARELARGYRPLDLRKELSGAASLLASAGVRTQGDPDALVAAVPRHLHEVVARVVREAITNVIRHSDATRVQLTCEDGVVRIANDRPRASSGDGTSSGLDSLASTVAGLGGRLGHAVVPGTDGEEFVLSLTLPR